jgi:hypothetical protein
LYGTSRFITVFTGALNRSLFSARSIQSIPSHPVPLRPTYVLVFPAVCFFLDFLPKPSMHSYSLTFLLHALPILLDLIILITLGEEYKLWRSSLCSFRQPPVTSSLFGPNILLSTLFSNTLSLCSSLDVRDQVSHIKHTHSYEYAARDTSICCFWIIFWDSRQVKEKQTWPANMNLLCLCIYVFMFTLWSPWLWHSAAL